LRLVTGEDFMSLYKIGHLGDVPQGNHLAWYGKN